MKFFAAARGSTYNNTTLFVFASLEVLNFVNVLLQMVVLDKFFKVCTRAPSGLCYESFAGPLLESGHQGVARRMG